MADGMDMGGGETAQPAVLEIVRAGTQSDGLLTVCEGKFHQVKRMFAARGKTVLQLRRLRVGGLWLDPSLKPGEIRELTEKERELIFL